MLDGSLFLEDLSASGCDGVRASSWFIASPGRGLTVVGLPAVQRLFRSKRVP